MANRIITRIGDIFCIEMYNEYKCYFQFIEIDKMQLGSSVIRAFKSRYPMDYKPVIEDIVNDDVLFYAHTILKFGIEYGIWYKVGKSKELGLEDLCNVIWGTVDIHKSIRVLAEEGYFKIIKVNPLENWTIWKVNEDMVNIGTLPKQYYNIIEEGIVFCYSNIVDRFMHGYYQSTSFVYDIIKRRPIDGVNSYIKREIEGNVCYFHYIGEDIYREIIVTPQEVIKLTQEEPQKNGLTFHARKFWEINWNFKEHITENDFLTAWNKCT